MIVDDFRYWTEVWWALVFLCQIPFPIILGYQMVCRNGTKKKSYFPQSMLLLSFISYQTQLLILFLWSIWVFILESFFFLETFPFINWKTFSKKTRLMQLSSSSSSSCCVFCLIILSWIEDWRKILPSIDCLL